MRGDAELRFGFEHVGEVVDPVDDLRPVCPNCHAVLHLSQCRSIEEVRQLLAQLKAA
jgi:predicted HNH restriction endonuclease